MKKIISIIALSVIVLGNINIVFGQTDPHIATCDGIVCLDPNLPECVCDDTSCGCTSACTSPERRCGTTCCDLSMNICNHNGGAATCDPRPVTIINPTPPGDTGSVVGSPNDCKGETHEDPNNPGSCIANTTDTHGCNVATEEWDTAASKCTPKSSTAATTNNGTTLPEDQTVNGITIGEKCLLNGQCKFNIYDTLDIRKSIREKGEATSVSVFVQDIVLSATFFIGTVVTIALIVSGLMFIFAAAGGKDELATKAKKGITGALIGLLIIACSYFIIRLVQYLAKGF